MTTHAQAEIAHAFVTARRNASALPEYPGLVPATLAEGYAIQALAMDLAGGTIGGWKVGRIAEPLVERYGANRLAGPIFTPDIQPISSGSVGRIFAEGFGAAEAEYLLRVGKTMAPGKTQYSLEEAAEYIDAVHIGIEIASSPFPGINELGPAVTVSDFGNNNGLLIGQAVEGWHDFAFSEQEVSLSIDGAIVGRGRAAAFPDGLLGSVRFLIENLAQRGIPLEAGAWISTGAITGVHPISLGQHVFADFGPLGTVQCDVIAQEAEKQS